MPETSVNVVTEAVRLARLVGGFPMMHLYGRRNGVTEMSLQSPFVSMLWNI